MITEDMDVMAPLHNYFSAHLFVAALFGALIGLERELAGKDPSLRTFSLISLGSCLFGMLSIRIAEHGHGDPSRIAAQIVVGIGFLGAGTIFRSRRGVSGLTTAALMWVTAAIGLSVGVDEIELAGAATLYALIIAVSLSISHRLIAVLRGGKFFAKPLE